MKLSDILDRLEREKTLTAVNAIENPSSKNLFEYGHSVGLYRGLDRALEIVDEILNEDEERRNRM